MSSKPDATNGVSKALLATRLKHRRWRSVRRGVAAINGTPATWRQAVHAAVLTAGPGAFVSHATAVASYGVEIRGLVTDLIHLSAERTKQLRISGVSSHRFQNLEDGDVVTRWGIPTASPLRIVVDLSSQLDDATLGRLVDEFLRRKQLKIDELHARVARLRPAPGRSVKRLQRVLAHRPPGYQPGDSELEGRILRLLRDHGFPTPRAQFWVRGADYSARIDHAYPDARLYLESDGFGWHQFASDLDNDSRRRNHLVIDGWRPLTFTWRMKDAEILRTMDGVYDRSTNTWRTVGAER